MKGNVEESSSYNQILSKKLIAIMLMVFLTVDSKASKLLI